MIRCLPEEVVMVQTLKPAADAAGRNGEGVSLKNALMAWVEVHIDQGNAATVLLTVEQCTAVAGTGNKAIPAVPIWANQDYGTGSPLTRQTDAANFTTSAAVKQKKVIFQIDPSVLDVANNFDCIRLNTGASNAANITQAEVRIAPRYPQSVQIDAKLD
jgi:hypothetical protein